MEKKSGWDSLSWRELDLALKQGYLMPKVLAATRASATAGPVVAPVADRPGGELSALANHGDLSWLRGVTTRVENWTELQLVPIPNCSFVLFPWRAAEPFTNDGCGTIRDMRLDRRYLIAVMARTRKSDSSAVGWRGNPSRRRRWRRAPGEISARRAATSASRSRPSWSCSRRTRWRPSSSPEHR